MSRNIIRLISVGKIRTPHWKQACSHYIERLNHWYTLQEVIVQDANSALCAQERSKIEGKNIIEKVSQNNMLICMDEQGKAMPSSKWAIFLQQILEENTVIPCFVIGGAYGLSEEIKSQAKHLFSFGPITLPHELARVVLLEQLYRAGSIVRKLPYHH